MILENRLFPEFSNVAYRELESYSLLQCQNVKCLSGARALCFVTSKTFEEAR